MPELTDLEVFVTVAREGSFSRAARTLGISRSYASKRVSSLEERLGVRLLHRTTRQVGPTDAGRRLYRRTGPLLEGIAEAEADAMEDGDVPRGTLRVAAPMAFGIRYIAPVIATFAARYPEVHVIVDYSDRNVDLVEEGFDVAIRGGPLPDSSLRARKVAPMSGVLAASDDYLERRGVPLHPDDLSEHACMLYRQRRRHDRWVLDGPGGQRASVAVSGPVLANNADALAIAAAAGLGIVMQPDFVLVDYIDRGELRVILAEWSAWSDAFWAVTPPHRQDSAKVGRFVDHLVAALAGAPWDRICAGPDRARAQTGIP